MDKASRTAIGDGRQHGLKGGPLSRGAATPLEDRLAAALEQARASYRDGQLDEAVARATEVEREAHQGRSQRLAAISGAAAVLTGLCERYNGQDDLARQAFTRAVDTLRRARKLVAERGDYAADLGLALAALSEPGPEGGPDASAGSSSAATAAEAESLLRYAMEFGEDTPDVRRGLAVALRSAGRFDEAVSLLNTSLGRSPQDWQAAAELARTLAASGAPRDDVTGAWAAAALATEEFGPPWRAAAMFDLAQAATATDPDLLRAAGRAWSQAGRYDDAVRALERSVQLNDQHTGAWIALAEAHLASGDADLALTTFREALQRDPDSLSALLGFAETALLYAGERGVAEEAERYARRATVVAPEEPAGYVALGEMLRLLERYQEAAAALDAGIDLLAPEAELLAFARGTRGQVRLALGDLTGGISDLEAAAELNPGLSWVQSDLGAAHLTAYQAGDHAREEDGSAHLAGAVDHLRRAVELNPYNAGAVVSLAGAQRMSGDNAAAAETYRALGMLQYQDNRHEDALASLEQAAELAPDDPEVLGSLGEIERVLGRFPGAITHLSEALRRQPDAGWMLASRGAAYMERDEIADGVSDFRAALDAHEVSPFLTSWLYRVTADAVSPALLAAWERAVQRAPDETDLRAALGFAYLNLTPTAGAGTPDRASYAESASRHLGLAAEGDSGDPMLLLALGAARLVCNDTAAAQEAIHAAVGLEPDVDALTNVAAFLYQLGIYAEALELADYALARRDDFAPALIARGKALAALERYPAAESALSAVPEDQRDASVWATLGEARRMTGHTEQAIRDLIQADRIGPDDAWTLASLGAAQVTSGQAENGAASLRRAVELAPGDLFAVSRLREALAGLGRNAEAVTLLKAAAGKVPDNADVRIQYATALGVAGQQREALDIIDDVLLLAPDNVVGLRVAGWLLSLLGRKPDAVASYSQAAELTPDDPEVLAELAGALQANRQPAEALAMLDRAADIRETADVAASRSRVFADLALWEAAITAGERAVDLDPANYAGLAALGWAIAHHTPVDASRMRDVFRDAVAVSGSDAGWAHRQLGQALLLLKRADEAREELLRALGLLLDRPLSDFESLWARGWCLYLLGRYREAAEAYSQAEPGLDSPLGVLLDSGLNSLVEGDVPKSRTEYKRGLSLAARDPASVIRGILAAAILDIGHAIELGWLAEGPVTAELTRSLSAALEACPLPEVITGTV